MTGASNHLSLWIWVATLALVSVLIYVNRLSTANKDLSTRNALLENRLMLLEDEASRRRLEPIPIFEKRKNSTYRAQNHLESMKSIGRRTGTDKISVHRYDRYYVRYLEPIRTNPIRMLEIGYYKGESFAMWKEFFVDKKSEVYFMDIKPIGAEHGSRGILGDSNNVTILQQIVRDKSFDERPLDFIIDDGGHHPEHQTTAFKYLFLSALKPGGIYIIEDIETSYWKNGDCYGVPIRFGKDHPDALMSKCKDLIDVVNRRFAPAKTPFRSSFGTEVDDWISSVSFGRNCVIVVKMDKAEQEWDKKPYVFESYLR